VNYQDPCDFRIQTADSCLEDAVEQCEGMLSNGVMTQLSSSLEVTVCELAACKDCCDEAQNQLAKLSDSSTKELNKTRMHALNMYTVKTSVICMKTVWRWCR